MGNIGRRWLAAALLASACQVVADAKPDVAAPSKAAAADADAVVLTFDTAIEPDTAVADVETSAPDLPPTCPSAAGCPCTEGATCSSGVCLDSGNGPACAQACSGDCPSGQACKQVPAAGGTWSMVCVPQYGHLCEPCQSSGNCFAAGLGTALCIDYGKGGRFCGLLCTGDGDCGEGYKCRGVSSVDGQKAKQCVRKDADGNDFGTCPCSAHAVKAGLSIACMAPFAAGDATVLCKGTRHCASVGDNGLTACQSAGPATETCDNADNDCDGQTDEDACDDGNACTTDICGDGAAGNPQCLHVAANGLPCDDGEPCTAGEKCSAGACKPAGLSCDCTQTSDCAAQEDGDLCNGTLFCDKSKLPYVCAVDLATVVTCDSGADTACATIGCDPQAGKCAMTANTDGTACEDGSNCTLGDACKGGLCGAGPAKSCADSNPCTLDACLPSGFCAHMPAAAACEDGNACTAGDACDPFGGCAAGKAVVCGGGGACATAACDPLAGCVVKPWTGALKNGKPCVLSDWCNNGQFVKGAPLDCDDGEACTKDQCDPVKGCFYVPLALGVTCDDGDACTGADTCTKGGCKGQPAINCDDGNPCTADTCKQGQCAHDEQSGSPCSDGNPCTTSDSCCGGNCLAGAINTCDDGNPCTVDSCDPAAGCLPTTYMANGTACSDGNPCTGQDTCQAGACIGVAQQPCLTASGCPLAGVGAACAGGKGTCKDGLCLHTDAAGYQWTLVPAGMFWMGCNAAVDSKCACNEKPQHPVVLAAYWIGVYELTAGIYQKCVAANGMGCTPPNPGADFLNEATYGEWGKADHPVNYVDWVQAQAACKWLGGDLPTEAQWEKAARGGCELPWNKDCQAAEPLYPWGSAPPACQTHGVFQDGKVCFAFQATEAVGKGSKQGGSPYGAYDMAGNVGEWTLDWGSAAFYGSKAAAAADPVNAVPAGSRVVRGGSFASMAWDVRASSRVFWPPDFAWSENGVRCVKAVK